MTRSIPRGEVWSRESRFTSTWIFFLFAIGMRAIQNSNYILVARLKTPQFS